MYKNLFYTLLRFHFYDLIIVSITLVILSIKQDFILLLDSFMDFRIEFINMNNIGNKLIIIASKNRIKYNPQFYCNRQMKLLPHTVDAGYKNPTSIYRIFCILPH